MKQKNYSSNGGFVTPYILFLIFTISVLLFALGFLFYSYIKKTDSIKKTYELNNSIDLLAYSIIDNFSDNAYETYDGPHSEFIANFELKYSSYNLSIKDCSTGINDFIFNDSTHYNDVFNKFMLIYSDELKTDYSWLNKTYTPKKILEEITATNGKTFNSSKIINSIPPLNVNYMSIDFLEAVFSLVNVSDYKKLANQIYNESKYEDLTIERLKNIFGPEFKKISKLCGVKTSFFEITLYLQNKKIILILGSIPKSNDDSIIDGYKLIDKKVTESDLHE